MKKLSTLAVLSVLLTASCVNDTDQQKTAEAQPNKPAVLHASAYVYDPATAPVTGTCLYDPKAPAIRASSFFCTR
jgi:hypothetical protein